MAKKKRNTGLPPGTAHYTGDRNNIPVYINYVEYDSEYHKEILGKPSEEILLFPSSKQLVQWYDIRGLHDINLINKLADSYKIHPIAIEDAIDVHQRPTHTLYQDGHFISMKLLSWNPQKEEVNRQSIAIYFGVGYVITFQEEEDDVFSDIRDRIKNKALRIRTRKADFLTYAIMDSVVDRYFGVLDMVEGKIEELEERIGLKVEEVKKDEIFRLKKELLKIRKSIAPLREAINSFSRTESAFVEKRTTVFIRDLYDHSIHIMDNVDSLRDVLSGLQDLYLSEISMKMNHVIQFLTVVTALFVPISFLTGLYGMNFEYIPELQYRSGYFILWGVMLLVVVGMLYYFWRKKWL